MSNMMLKAYRYRIYPTEEQAETMRKHFGACRFIYNWGLEQKIKAYETEGKTMSRFDLQKIMVHRLKKEHTWLKEVNSQSLLASLINLDSAFTRFFREKKGFPRFKSKKNCRHSFNVPQHYTVNFDDNTVKLPKIGAVKTVLHRRFTGKTKSATISTSSTGKFHISILVDDEQNPPEKQQFDENTTIGIDVGISHFATFSTGEKIENPHFLKESLQRLKVLQRRLSRKKKGSNNRRKALIKVARQHERIANQRNDFLHKVSYKLVSENQAVAIENLNVKGMMRNHHLSQSISDTAWGMFFRMLEYKSEWYGKTLLRIGQFEPSSKICNVCGHVNNDLKLSDREWECSECKTQHDRDVNASINIKKFALQGQNIVTLGQRGGACGGVS